MSVADLAKFIGREAAWSPMSGFAVPVRIVDVRQAFGRVDFRVTPIGGTGEVWMSGVRVKVDGLATVAA